MVVVVALAAALAYAMASVFQQHTAAQAPHSDTLRVGLLVRLAVRPLWLAGILADVIGYVLQFIALGHGSLVLVQPLLVCGLLFALPFGALFSHRRWLSWNEWVGSGLVVVGLAVFLVIASPASGSSTASLPAWAIVSGATLLPAGLLVGASLRTTGSARASLQAVAAGAVYGLAAAYTKTVSAMIASAHGGLGRVAVAVVTTWQTYAIVLSGILTLVLVQSAFQAGPLGWSLPALTVVDPIVSILIGAFAFHEPISSSVPAIAAEVVGGLAMVGGVAVLARSPFVPHRAQEVGASAAGDV